MVEQIEVTVDQGLHLDREFLKKAGLHGRIRVIVRPGEIRILQEQSTDPEDILDRLAGSLGEESAAEYDFGLKIGGLYEAR